MNYKKVRGVISSILLAAALLSLSSAVILYFLKYGMWLIFTRNFLYNTHVISGLIMAIAIIIHFIINFRLYVVELKVLLGTDRKPKKGTVSISGEEKIYGELKEK